MSPYQLPTERDDLAKAPPAPPVKPGGSAEMFKLFGIRVYVHWSWLIVAVIEINNRRDQYQSIAWNIAEYLALFAIVLTHEFGHALACRSVGGEANRIMLWPLGGVAFVDPPQRPGAVLWSIVAGPLVNVILLPVTIGLLIVSGVGPLSSSGIVVSSDLQHFLVSLAGINLILLVFNMLPIYPLDGGQILRALLWFFIGAGRSLMVASMIGLVGSVAGLGLALLYARDNIFLILIAGFAALQSWQAFQRSKAMRMLSETPRRTDARCPACGQPPLIAPMWKCPCGQVFDTFETHGNCPRCGAVGTVTQCLYCRQASPIEAWYAPTSVVAPAEV